MSEHATAPDAARARLRRRWRLALLPLTLVAVPMATPEAGEDSVSPAPAVSAATAVLRIGNGTEPESLDPQRATGVSAGNILRDLFESLTTIAADGSVQPAAAAHWQWQPDPDAGAPPQLQLTLRSGLRWSNGEPLTAEHYAAGLRRLLDPATASGYAALLGAIRHGDAVRAGRLPPSALGVQASDPQRLVIRLDRPQPNLPSLLALPAAAPVHPNDLAREPAVDRRIGNGAYRLLDWRLHDRIELVRNPHYRAADEVAIPRILYLPTEDLDAEFKRYRAGEIDITAAIPALQAARIRRDHGRELRIAPYLGSYFYGLNVERPPFAGNPALREALSLAIDRELIAERVLQGLAAPAWTLVPPGADGHEPPMLDWARWPRARREAEARRRYAEAGFDAAHPAEVEIRYNTQDDHRRIAIVVAAMWKQVLGVRTTLVNEEWKSFLRHRRERRLTQAFRNVWIGDSDDALGFLELFESGHPRNDSGYRSAPFDAAIAAARAADTRERRRAALVRAERQLLGDLPLIPIHHYRSKHLVRDTVDGWQDHPLDWHPSRDLRLRAAPSSGETQP